ncbi:MAG: hypothetical protein PHN17_09565 [Syntrophaceticus sp.]|nr:hypothetical protein [Syntrophaceticus sp.]
MSNKKCILCCIFLLFIFVFTLTITEKHGEAATQVSGYKNFSHTAYSINWGIKTFKYRNSYICNVITGFSGYSYKAATNQDILAYKTPEDYIYPPEVGNGAVGLQGVYLLDTNNNVNNSQNPNQWSAGLINSRILPGGTKYLLSRYCYVRLEGIPNATYRVQVRTTFALPSSWSPFLWTDYTYTPWF